MNKTEKGMTTDKRLIEAVHKLIPFAVAYRRAAVSRGMVSAMADVDARMSFAKATLSQVEKHHSVEVECLACGGRGFLVVINDTYGKRVERCDACMKYKSDDEAHLAMYYFLTGEAQ